MRLSLTSQPSLQALGQLDTLREYEAALLGEGVGPQGPPSLGLAAHAFQTAEACRLAHPGADWFALAGLLHGLGKLLAHSRCGTQFCVGLWWHPSLRSWLQARSHEPISRACTVPAMHLLLPARLSLTSPSNSFLLQLRVGIAVGGVWGELPGGLPA